MRERGEGMQGCKAVHGMHTVPPQHTAGWGLCCTQLNMQRHPHIKALSYSQPTMTMSQAPNPEFELPAAAAPTMHLLSLDAHRRNNLWYIEEDVLVMAAGNRVVFLKQPLMVGMRPSIRAYVSISVPVLDSASLAPLTTPCHPTLSLTVPAAPTAQSAWPRVQ